MNNFNAIAPQRRARRNMAAQRHQAPQLKPVTKPQAEQWLVERLGPKLQNWQQMNSIKPTSELLNRAFGTGFSVAGVYRMQREWHQGVEFFKVGGKTSYDLCAIAQWVLARQ